MRRRPRPRRRGLACTTAALALALALAVTLPAAACALVYKRPSVRVVAVRVTDLGLTGGTSRVRLEVSNPNRYGLEVRALDYHLEVEDRRSSGGWQELAAGARSDTLRIAARSTAEVDVDVPFRYEAAGAAAMALLQRGSVRYRARGSVRVAGPLGALIVPFESTGEVVR